MEVGVGVLRHVVVEDDVHALDVHPAAEQVRGDKNALQKKQTIFIFEQVF